jgi:hypothetical protein
MPPWPWNHMIVLTKLQKWKRLGPWYISLFFKKLGDRCCKKKKSLGNFIWWSLFRSPWICGYAKLWCSYKICKYGIPNAHLFWQVYFFRFTISSSCHFLFQVHFAKMLDSQLHIAKSSTPHCQIVNSTLQVIHCQLAKLASFSGLPPFSHWPLKLLIFCPMLKIHSLGAQTRFFGIFFLSTYLVHQHPTHKATYLTTHIGCLPTNLSLPTSYVPNTYHPHWPPMYLPTPLVI